MSDQARTLLAEALEYMDHQSWRCEHRPHFYLANPERSQEIMDAEDCPCGLLAFERKVLALLGDDA